MSQEESTQAGPTQTRASLPVWFETRWGLAVLAAAVVIASVILLFSLVTYFWIS
jgi:hypothetical protein